MLKTIKAYSYQNVITWCVGVMAFFLMCNVPVTTFAFQGNSPYQSLPQYKSVFPSPSGSIDSSKIFAIIQGVEELAWQLFSNLEDRNPHTGQLADGLIVTSFVDLDNVYRTSSLGRYLTEQLMNEFQRHSYAVVEVRKSNSVLIQNKRGEFGLSREYGEISSEVSATTMLTGTYTVGDDHIIVNARILDNRNAALVSSATVVFGRNDFINRLLAKSGSLRAVPKEVAYMKKLER